jgi:tetratricopeptide (TPR) repeat protein
MGLRHAAPQARNNLGFAMSRQGRLDEGAMLVSLAAEQLRTLGNPTSEADARKYLAAIELERGQLDVAETAARRAMELLEPMPALRPHPGAILARVLLAQGRRDEALAEAQAAMAALRSSGGIIEGEPVVYLALVEALQAHGDRDAAATLLAEAHAHLRRDAEQISDPALRASFLERVPENARIRALAAAR